jgi:NAD-dependent SIR2 family protein deacetylase
MGIVKFVISQNVDNLHIKSGLKIDYLAELHGNYNLYKCLGCDRRFTVEEIKWDKTLFGNGYRNEKTHPNQPKCSYCNGRIISSIINFGDPMPEKEMIEADYHTSKADVFLVLGSSLVVQPAASFPLVCYENGGKILILNKGETPLDNIATVKIEKNISEILRELVTKIKEKKTA